ncbi:MAG: hypothetical protein ABEJ27_06080 [Halodesulfurarchaeum sp.]
MTFDNNFNLAVAVFIGLFGGTGDVGFTAVIGPLIDGPLLVSLVNRARFFEERFDWRGQVRQASLYEGEAISEREGAVSDA